MQPYAGNGYGAVFVPEKGDEVLVAFVHGDMRFPIVLGGLYNGIDKPPTDRTASQDQKLIRTKHGHQVLLDDSPGQEAIRVTTAGGRELILDDVSGTVAVTGSGVKITLEDSGTVTVQGADGHRRGRCRSTLGSAAAALSPILGERVHGDLQRPHPRAPVPARWSPPRPVTASAAADQPRLLPDREGRASEVAAMSENFLGTGWAFPVLPDPAGGLRYAVGEDSIQRLPPGTAANSGGGAGDAPRLRHQRSHAGVRPR